MALTDFVAVRARQRPSKSTAASLSSSDARYWKSFRTKDVSRQIAAVNYIHFCPEPPDDFAITSSTRVAIFDGQSCTLKKTFSKFKDVAYSGVLRSDGQILSAGGETGIIQVFDVNTKKILRQLKGHARPVRMVRYAPGDKLHLLSGGDDCMVKWWDITTQENLQDLVGHKDYVRCGSASPSTSNLWATGSYDHTVRLWDLSSSRTVLELKHGKPVEDIAFFPSGGLVATAGGNIVKIWDIIGGGRAIHAMESHQKTVMSICISNVLKAGQNSSDAPLRLITASLDGYMKTFDVNSFKMTHSAKFPSPIRAMDISSSCMTMAIGTQSGDLFIRQRKNQEEGMKPQKQAGLGIENLQYIERNRSSVIGPQHYCYFFRGLSEKPSKEDHIVKKKKRLRLTVCDKALKRFQHTEALASALKSANPQDVVPVMEELIVRKNLMNVIMNISFEDFELLIIFLCKFSTSPSYSRFLLPLTDKILDRRSQDLGKSARIKQELVLLKKKVNMELTVQETMQELQGIIQPLICSSS